MSMELLDKSGLAYFWTKIKAYVAGLLSSKADDSDVVHKAGDESVTGTKTFVGSKKIAFKQSVSNDKLGFTLFNNSNVEKGYLEYNPTNQISGVPLMTLGNYATAAAGLTYVGFRKYSNISGAAGAYNLLTPLISDAMTPFNLTTTYTNFFLPLGVTDGTTTFTTAKSGLLDLSAFNAASASAVAWSGVTGKPTTISGYGITDAKIDNGTITLGSASITPLTSHQTLPTLSRTVSGSGNAITDITVSGHAITATKDATYITSSGSITGNAGTATKFASSQSVTLTGAVTGTASSQAGWSVGTIWRSCMVGQSGSTNTNPWYKVATFAATGANDDIIATFLVEDTYSSHKQGILKVHVRTDGSKVISSTASDLIWLSHTGFTLADFVLVCPTAASSTVELWTKIATGYMFRRFTVLSEGSRSSTSIRWTLLNASSAGQAASITTSGTQIASTLAGNAATASSAAKLTTARKINGVSFDGSADVTLTAVVSSASRSADIAANGTFTVPSYIVGAHALLVYLDGCLSRQDDGWSEVGTAGAASTTIKFLQIIPKAMEIVVRVN